MSLLCTFFVGESWLGLPIEEVQETLAGPTVVPVPAAPERVLGVVNLRGDILTVLALGPRADRAPAAPVVIVRRTGERVGLGVDRLGDVIDVPPTLFQPPPSAPAAAGGPPVKGAFALPHRILSLLDLNPLLESAEGGLA